jgi:3-oxoacyl-(acyl-carrier-protein) synthase
LSTNRVAVTGMAINTPLGDTLDGFLAGLLAGKSAISRWRVFNTDNIYSKVGGDLSGYDIAAKVESLKGLLPADMHQRLRRLTSRVAWSTRHSALLGAQAWRDAALGDAGYDPRQIGVIVAGHNLSSNYTDQNRSQFVEEPDYIEAMFALHSLDTDHAGTVSEVLQAKGPIFTIGAACASGNAALRCAVDEIRHHGIDAVAVVGAVLEFAPIDLHGMALMGAITFESFNDAPDQASRPYDKRREGFVPAHGGGVLIVENLEKARARGARIYAEVMGVEARSDGSHLPQPSVDGQVAVMRSVLERSGIAPEEVDFVSAHATSTPLGDVTEIRSIKEVFGKHAKNLKINAPKSMLGHTCWAAPTVEAVAAILQMNAGRMHPSINVTDLDPEVDLDVSLDGPRNADIRCIMKNSFGFGGINCVSVFRRYEG